MMSSAYLYYFYNLLLFLIMDKGQSQVKLDQEYEGALEKFDSYDLSESAKGGQNFQAPDYDQLWEKPETWDKGANKN